MSANDEDHKCQSQVQPLLEVKLCLSHQHGVRRCSGQSSVMGFKFNPAQTHYSHVLRREIPLLINLLLPPSANTKNFHVKVWFNRV